MTVYQFVGPPQLWTCVPQTARVRVQGEADVRAWARTQSPEESLIATFVVDGHGALWIADRRSEHIACARGGRVQAAGEIEFEIGVGGVEVVGATNQSTGFCPRVESWAALEQALDAAQLKRPSTWTRAFEFRHCEVCGALNIVKDEWFVCATCDADLPEEWNIGNDRRDESV